jgi:hypothetical protein
MTAMALAVILDLVDPAGFGDCLGRAVAIFLRRVPFGESGARRPDAKLGRSHGRLHGDRI